MDCEARGGGGESHFLILCFRENLECYHKICELRKIGRRHFKDFFLRSLMFHAAVCMTEHMSLFLCGGLRVQRQSTVN